MLRDSRYFPTVLVSTAAMLLVGAAATGSSLPGPPSVRAAAPLLGPSETASTQGTGVPLLVSTEWVAAHSDDPDVLVVHVGMFEMGRVDAFIPRAVPLEYHDLESSETLAIEIAPLEQLVATLEAAGISNDKHVVLYSDGAAHVAARAFVTLEYLGHRRVSVMDGGIAAWIADGRPTVPAPAAPTPDRFTPAVDESILVDADWILARLEDPAVAIIDARPADQYAGPSNRGLREGHIPGAGNLYYVELLASEDVPRLKPRDQVEALFAGAGAGPGKTVVSYCQIGMRASYNYLIARHLGYDVKFYDPSWQEWGARTDLPAETGPGRRDLRSR